jgi:4'-phosphopantetheinyl transferase EntD
MIERLFESERVAVACRSVNPNDASLLTPEERDSLAGSVPAVRCRAAAARIAARELLSEAGFPGWSMPRRRGNPPHWPPGLVGSLSHSDFHAAAAVARREEFAAVGVDIEPAEPLPPELVDLVTAPGEARPSGAQDLLGRVLFCAKEACYKAVYPLDGRFLEHDQIVVDLCSGVAETRYGRRAQLTVHVDHRIVVLARVPANGGEL